MRHRRVTVSPLPCWLDHVRLLGGSPSTWTASEIGPDLLEWHGELELDASAELAARLHGLGFAGQAVAVQVEPPLSRAQVRGARLREARRRRGGAPGFARAGARMDDEGRLSLTPEALALRVGELARDELHAGTVLDAGCGVGGNTIGFARAGLRVTAVDRSASRLEMARHNLRLYGVEDRVELVHGEAAEVLAGARQDLLFVDPPWGGRGYDHRCFDLEQLDLLALALTRRRDFRGVWAKVPPSADTRALSRTDAAADLLDPLPYFGVDAGDAQRVKFLLLRFVGAR